MRSGTRPAPILLLAGLAACGAPVVGGDDGAVVAHDTDRMDTDREEDTDGGDPPDTAARDHWGDADTAAPVDDDAVLTLQCAGLAGGLCASQADGRARVTWRSTGRVPFTDRLHQVWYHTDAWEIRRHHARTDVIVPGGGAFVRRAPNGQLIFQCRGLEGGVCRMEWDGRDRVTLEATGRVPDMDDRGRVLFHTDTYRVKRRDADGTLTDLGVGAHARWRPDGGVIFQCEGLGGGVCTMDADGSDRRVVSATGRNPDLDADGRMVWHTDTWRLIVRQSDGTTDDVGEGAFGSWRQR